MVQKRANIRGGYRGMQDKNKNRSPSTEAFHEIADWRQITHFRWSHLLHRKKKIFNLVIVLHDDSSFLFLFFFSLLYFYRVTFLLLLFFCLLWFVVSGTFLMIIIITCFVILIVGFGFFFFSTFYNIYIQSFIVSWFSLPFLFCTFYSYL